MFPFKDDLFATININMSPKTDELSPSRGGTSLKPTATSTNGSVNKHSYCKKQKQFKFPILLLKLVSYLKNITTICYYNKDLLSQCTNYQKMQNAVCSGNPQSFLSVCYSLMNDKTLIPNILNSINSCGDDHHIFEADTFLSALLNFFLEGEILSRYIPSLDQISELVNTSVKNPIMSLIQTAETRSIFYLECYHPSLEISECGSGQKRERSECHKSNPNNGRSSKRQCQSHSTSGALVSSSNSSGSGDDERDNNNGRDRQRIPRSATPPTPPKARKQKGKRTRKRGRKHRKKSRKNASKVKHRRSSRACEKRSRTHDLSHDIVLQKARRESHCRNSRNPIRSIRDILLCNVSSPEPIDSEDGGDFTVVTKWPEGSNTAAMIPSDSSLVPPNFTIPPKPTAVTSRETPQFMDPPSVLEITPNVKTSLDPDSKYSRNVSAVNHVNRTSPTIVPGVGEQIKQTVDGDQYKHETLSSSMFVSGVSYADRVKVKDSNGDTSSSNNPAQQVYTQTVPSAHVRKKGEADAPLSVRGALQNYTGDDHAIGEGTLNQTDCMPPDSAASNVAILLQQQNSKCIISQFLPARVEDSSPVGNNTGSLVPPSLSDRSSDASEVASTDANIMTHQNLPPAQQPPDNAAPLVSQSMVVLPLSHQPSEIEASALQVIPFSFPYEESTSRNRSKLLTRQHSLSTLENDQIQVHGSLVWTQSIQESECGPVQNFCLVTTTSEWHFRPPRAQVVEGIDQEEHFLAPVQAQPQVTEISQHLGSSDYRSFSALVEILPFQPQTNLTGMYSTNYIFVGFYASYA